MVHAFAYSSSAGSYTDPTEMENSLHGLFSVFVEVVLFSFLFGVFCMSFFFYCSCSNYMHRIPIYRSVVVDV